MIYRYRVIPRTILWLYATFLFKNQGWLIELITTLEIRSTAWVLSKAFVPRVHLYNAQQSYSALTTLSFISVHQTHPFISFGFSQHVVNFLPKYDRSFIMHALFSLRLRVSSQRSDIGSLKVVAGSSSWLWFVGMLGFCDS